MAHTKDSSMDQSYYFAWVISRYNYGIITRMQCRWVHMVQWPVGDELYRYYRKP